MRGFRSLRKLMFIDVPEHAKCESVYVSFQGELNHYTSLSVYISATKRYYSRVLEAYTSR